MKYFTKINTVEELKKQYFSLAKKYHSDINGGSDEMMKAINAEYTELFKVYKDVHQSTKKDAENATYTAEKATNEAPVDFINIISELLKMPGIAVELCGRWLWIGGDTKPYKDKLKEIGCKWCNTKKLWSWHHPEDSVYKHKTKNMSEIREAYGSQIFTNGTMLLA